MADSIFRLEVVRARYGDCLLLHYGTEDEPKLALIDGGPTTVYRNFLRPRLEQIRDERGLDEDTPLRLNLVMLSHIDEDHVFGLLDLTEELLDAKQQHAPRIVEIEDLWHNTFDDIIDNDAQELTQAVTASFGAAALNGELPDDLVDELDAADQTDAVIDTIKIVASVAQGRDLRINADNLEIERNVETDGKLVMAPSEPASFDMGGGLSLTVAGPMLDDVKTLQKKHKEFLRTHPELAQHIAAALAEYADNSPYNLSSIVALATSGDRKILFTGDARGDKIIEGLELVGIAEEGKTLHVDVLKGPHHGSSNNVSLDFFQRITADHYVFSGNGKFGNPERATLEALADARGSAPYEIHLTYPIDEIDRARKDDWDQHREDELRRHETRPATTVRPEWSDADNSLAAFLDANPDVRERVSFVEEGVPHSIDLSGQA
ncbi:ComEC/Rec2 family competence protein [Mycolicibacterium helvum]|uniref:MBL fold hydrolase n=1 Tax=Mycolicibacterium helvum TaxID=1534349 RepID=A0A7I7SZD7_9MYCO|nr:hypothetical protein [Mycolicibacterium helvum]BBY62424.1 MBL fold hydrolase [Mycolicibacterium helvum]